MSSDPEELHRIARLRALDLLDTDPEPPFEELVQAAAALCATPASVISLIDDRRLWRKASVGLEGWRELPRELSFCQFTIARDALFQVEDALLDPRFSANPLVTAPDGIRFYAGMPLVIGESLRIGTLAVMDTRPRRLSPGQQAGLAHLAGAAVTAIRMREALRASAGSRHLATIVEHSDEAIIGKSLESLIISWNEGAERLFGYSRDEMVGHSITRLFPPGREDEEEQLMTRVRAGETVREFETVRRRKDGKLIEIAVSLSPIRDAAGKVIGVAKIARDIRRQMASVRALAASESRYRALVEEQAELVSLATPGGVLTFVNSAYVRHVGLGREQLLGTSLYDYIPSEERDAVAAQLAQVCLTFQPMHIENRMMAVGGTPRSLAWTNVALTDDTGRVIAIHSVGRDITERVLHRQEIARQNELLRVTLASIGEGVITCDAEGRVSWMNVVAERMTGWSKGEATGRRLSEVFPLFHAGSRTPAGDPVEACLSQGIPVALSSDAVLVSRDGTEYGVADSAAPIRTGQGELVGAVLVFRDVTEQRRLVGEMRFRATHDALTGALNRGEFDLRLADMLQRASECEHRHALLFIDLDHFKSVNDGCGHQAGDRLLEQVARLFGDCVRARDVVARLGGDEFGILLEDCAVQQAERVAATILARLAAFRFEQDDANFQIGASIGLVIIDRHSPEPATLLLRADQACYAAKADGRQRVRVWREQDLAPS